MTRIALIHALSHSVRPINEVFDSYWPQALRMNLLDDSLSADLARTRLLDDAMDDRFAALASYALSTGADGILFTCSAFGPCIERVAQAHPHVPILKPNEAMIDELRGGTGKLGLIATFEPTLQSMPREFGNEIELELGLARGALAALEQGDALEHDRLIVEEARKLHANGCSRLALAQVSMARASAACATATGLRISTTVESAIRAFRLRLRAD